MRLLLLQPKRRAHSRRRRLLSSERLPHFAVLRFDVFLALAAWAAGAVVVVVSSAMQRLAAGTTTTGCCFRSCRRPRASHRVRQPWSFFSLSSTNPSAPANSSHRFMSNKDDCDGSHHTHPLSRPPPVVLPPYPIPRAAVSVCVRCQIRSPINKESSDMLSSSENNCDSNCCYFYLLIQRGKEPNKGRWSFPGGSIEYGETALAAGQRELAEETRWMVGHTTTTTMNHDDDNDCDDNCYGPGESQQLPPPLPPPLRWYDGTVTTSDAVGEGYHYLIAHCFAEVVQPQQPPHQDHPATATKWTLLPNVRPADDAADAQWFTYQEICDMELRGNATTTTTSNGSHHRSITPGVMRVLQRIQSLAHAGLLTTTTTPR